MIKQTLYFIGILLCFYSCISDLDLDYPEADKQPILNCIMQNDSAISAQLSWSATKHNGVIEPILKANVSLFLSGELIETVNQSDAKGNYFFKHIATRNKEYEITAAFDQSVLSAKTTSVSKPNITIDREFKEYSNDVIKISINKVDESVGALYLFIYNEYTSYEDQSKYWCHEFLFCNSPFVDDFNAYSFSGGPDGFHYLYDYFVRVDANNLRSTKAVINLVTLIGSEKVKVRILTTNPLYDAYFKSAYLQRTFDPEINLPFSYYPVPIPSNIEGGLGIFSGIDITEFVFDDTAKNDSTSIHY